MSKEYDLIIISRGAGAFSAANTSNKLKKRALLINYEKMKKPCLLVEHV